MSPLKGKAGNDKRQRTITFDPNGTIKINTPQRDLFKNSEHVVNGDLRKKNEKNKNSKGTFGLFYKKYYTYVNVPKERKGLNYLLYRRQFCKNKINKQIIISRQSILHSVSRRNHTSWDKRRE